MGSQAPSFQNPNQSNVPTTVTPNDQDNNNSNAFSSNASSIASAPVRSSSTSTSNANPSTCQSNNTINNMYDQQGSNRDAMSTRNLLVSESTARTIEMMQLSDNRTAMQTPFNLAMQLMIPKCTPHHTPIVQRQTRESNQNQSTRGAWQSQMQVKIAQTNHEKSIWNSVESHTVHLNAFVDDEESHAARVSAVDFSAASVSTAKIRTTTYYKQRSSR